MVVEANETFCYKGDLDRFAKSSGTSGGRSKFIPVPRTHLKSVPLSEGASDTLWLYLSTRPDSCFSRQKVLSSEAVVHQPASNILQGDLSSILIENMLPLANLIRVPSRRSCLWTSGMPKWSV